MTSDGFTVTGTVKRTFTTRGGHDGVAVTVQNPRSKHPDEVTVWATLDVAPGDRVTVQGDYSDRVDTVPTPSGLKPIIRRNLSNVTLIERCSGEGDTA